MDLRICFCFVKKHWFSSVFSYDYWYIVWWFLLFESDGIKSISKKRCDLTILITETNGVMILVASNRPPIPTSIIAMSTSFQNIQMQVQLSFQKTHVIGFKKVLCSLMKSVTKSSVYLPLILMRSKIL
jgi:hypothetical protein